MLEFPVHQSKFKRFDKFRDRSDQTEWVIQEIQPRVTTTRYRLQSMTSSTMIWRTEDELVVKFDHLPWGTPKPKDGCEWGCYCRDCHSTPNPCPAEHHKEWEHLRHFYVDEAPPPTELVDKFMADCGFIVDQATARTLAERLIGFGWRL